MRLCVLEHHRDRVGGAGSLGGEQLRQGRGRDRMRGVVPPSQDRVALVRAENVQAADRQVGRRNRRRQQTNKPLRQRFDTVALEQVAPIVEPQPQPLSRYRHQTHRIMRGVVPADIGETQPAGLCGQAGALDRIVLEHHQGVEQLAQSGERLDLGQAQMLVRDQPGLAVLRLLQQGPQRLGGRQPHAQRERVDEQPHHGLDAGNLRRPARHRDAEHHVVAAGQTAKQNRPGGLDEGVQRQTLLARLPRQRRGERLAQRQRDLLGRRQAPAPDHAAPAGSAPPARPKPPARPRCAAARSWAAIQAQIIPIRSHRRQARCRRPGAHRG